MFAPPLSPAPSHRVPLRSPSPSPAKGQAGQIKNYVDQMSKPEQDKCSAAFARAAYVTSCPLSLFEHPLWQEAFHNIRPSFKPPKKDAMGGKLLDSEYDRVKMSADDKIKGATYLALASDGYSNDRGDGLLNFVVLTPEPVFYKTIDLKDKREDSVLVANEHKKVIEELGPQRVTLIVTDNVIYNVIAWNLIREWFPHIACVGCAAHSFNLLMTDLGKMKSLQKIVTMGKVLYKGVRRCRRALAFFKMEQKRLYTTSESLKLPSRTRFWGTVIFLESIVNNKSALQSTVLQATTDPNPRDPDEKQKFHLKRKLKTVALDEEYFWARIGDWIKVLKPIAHAIEYIESDSVLLSDVPQLFSEINVKTVKALEESQGLKKLSASVKTMIRDRKDFACKDVHFAANLVDPNYKGANLTPEEKIRGSEYIADLCDNLLMSQEEKQAVLSNLTEFRGDAGIWSKESVRNSYHNVSPALWWKTTCCGQPLAPIAVRLLMHPPHSASVERNWSCYGRVHTKLRNRLKNERVEKLVAIQMNMKYYLPHLVKTTAKVAKRRQVSLSDEMQHSEGEVVSVGADGETNDLEEVDLLDIIDETDEESDSEWEEESGDEDEEDQDVGAGLFDTDPEIGWRRGTTPPSATVPSRATKRGATNPIATTAPPEKSVRRSERHKN